MSVSLCAILCRLKKQLQELAAKEAAAAAKEGVRRPKKGLVPTPLTVPAQLPGALASQKSLSPALSMLSNPKP